ncbi:AMP-binding protein [uncultured Roseobacter sp.]|uniref:AMP-binding protein n=1 Tax=uncultured Roseobacter sp. TaxID=114847 RepID=UPI0026212D11|nr:AMP-binding protein [uncultured Roseobacter sp.]
MNVSDPISIDPAKRVIHAIDAANSLEFLSAVLACYDSQQLFAITRPDIDPAQYAGTVVPRSHDATTRGWGAFDHTPSTSDAPAQIVFTSGTEGKPKAIVLSHRNLADVVGRLNDVMQVTSEIREYIGIPVTYSFGLGRVRAVSAAGGRFYLPERFDPLEIRRMLEAGEINALSAVPSLLRLLLQAPEAIGQAGAQMRWIEIGSQYMSAAEKAQLVQLFPNARIVQHYGMTEASRSTFLVISDHEDPDVLESVGPAHHVEITGDGAIRLRGAHVALGRFDDTGALVPLTDDTGWMTTKDRGEIRNGHLYFLGRVDDQMNLGGIKIGAEALEAAVLQIVPAAKGHFAITSTPDALRGEVVLLAAEAPATDIMPVLEAATLHALTQKGISAGASLRKCLLDELPRTATGKIRRAALRTQGTDPADDTPPANPGEAQAPLSQAEAKLAEIWCSIVGSIPLDARNTFYDAGGDSLSGLQLGLAMESKGYSRAVINATLAGRTLAETARMAEASEGTSSTAQLPAQTQISWALTLTRGIVVISVLLMHWGHGLFNALSVPSDIVASMWTFLRMGTPGFAFVFGLGIGLYMLPYADSRPQAVYHRMHRAFWLVMIGVVLQAAVFGLRGVQLGNPVSGLLISNVFYGVLTYYAIVLATGRLWLPLLARIKAPVQTCLLLAFGMWLSWIVARDLITDVQQYSLLELPRLMLSAGYSIFKLGAMTLAGVALGSWIYTQNSPELIARRLLFVGSLGTVFCIGLLSEAYGVGIFFRNAGEFTSLPGLAFYGCLCTLLMGVFLYVTAVWHRIPLLLCLPLRGLIVLGGMALPIYAFHQIVRPARDSMVLLGMPDMAALGLAVGVFTLLMGYIAVRIYRMYFN